MVALPRHETKRSGIDLLHLIGAGSSAAFVYYAILLHLPLLASYTLRLKNLTQMPREEWPRGLLIIWCIALLFASYAIGHSSLAAMRDPARGRLAILGFPVLFVVLLSLVFPLTSTDIYDYLFRGRMLAHYGANTFANAPEIFPNDPLLPYVAWKEAVTAYGPVWEYMSGGLAWAIGETAGALGAPEALLLRYLLAYKALALLGYMLCAGAIWRALSNATPAQRWTGLYLWLWNPLVVWETAAAGHNDVWMAALIVLALATMAGKSADNSSDAPARGFSTHSGLVPLLLLTAGGLIKFVAFFFGPVVLAALLRRLPNHRARARLLVLGGCACAALIALAYAPFWAGSATFQNIGARRSLATSSWLVALQPLLARLVTESQAQTIAAIEGTVLLTLGIGWGSWRAWREPADIAAHVFWLTMWFLFLCNPWFQPWYIVWVVPLIAIQPWRGRAVLAVGVFCCTALMSYIIDGLVLPAFGFADKSFGREGLISLFIYLPPLLVLGWDQLALGRSLKHVLNALTLLRYRRRNSS